MWVNKLPGDHTRLAAAALGLSLKLHRWGKREVCSGASAASHLEDSRDDEHVVSGERELKAAAVQSVPQLPDSPSPRRTAEDAPGPRALGVQERQHVLVGDKGLITVAKVKPLIFF